MRSGPATVASQRLNSGKKGKEKAARGQKGQGFVKGMPLPDLDPQVFWPLRLIQGGKYRDLPQEGGEGTPDILGHVGEGPPLPGPHLMASSQALTARSHTWWSFRAQQKPASQDWLQAELPEQMRVQGRGVTDLTQARVGPKMEEVGGGRGQGCQTDTTLSEVSSMPAARPTDHATSGQGVDRHISLFCLQGSRKCAPDTQPPHPTPPFLKC